VAASGSTDCALGRASTPSPGDRRVYSRAESRDYPAIVAAVREGRTFATNGGPVFPFLTIDGHGPGETLEPGGDRPLAVRAEVHSLRPLRSAKLYRRGALVREFDAAGRRGEVVLEDSRREEPGGLAWYVLRVEDEAGAWAITSPIFVEAPAARSREPGPASALILEIHNATRYVELRREFFAHLIATVSPGDPLASVELLRDGRSVRRFTPDEGDSRAGGQVPVTGPRGEYAQGWAWHAGPGGTLHLQADWPVSESGWYGLRATTVGGRAIASEEVRFEAGEPASRAITAARLEGPGTTWEHRGYGEEMPLAEIREPFEGDHWWYPLRNAWRVRAEFDGERREVGYGDVEGRFRPATVTR
jgi:hypothetical protein